MNSKKSTTPSISKKPPVTKKTDTKEELPVAVGKKATAKAKEAATKAPITEAKVTKAKPVAAPVKKIPKAKPPKLPTDAAKHKKIEIVKPSVHVEALEVETVKDTPSTLPWLQNTPVVSNDLPKFETSAREVKTAKGTISVAEALANSKLANPNQPSVMDKLGKFLKK